MFGRRKKQQPEDKLLNLLMELVGDTGDGTFKGRVLGKALHDAKPGGSLKMIAGPGFNMIDCDSIADQIGSLELTGRSFLILHEALLAFHAHEADDNLCENCHDSLHELIKTTANTLKGMVETAARK